MKNTKYHKDIIDTINTLIECERMTFTAGLNLLMQHEWSDINDKFEPGEVFDFELEHLESAEDTNILLIAKLVKEISKTINSLQNLNAIEDEEINR